MRLVVVPARVSGNTVTGCGNSWRQYVFAGTSRRLAEGVVTVTHRHNAATTADTVLSLVVVRGATCRRQRLPPDRVDSLAVRSGATVPSTLDPIDDGSDYRANQPTFVC